NKDNVNPEILKKIKNEKISDLKELLEKIKNNDIQPLTKEYSDYILKELNKKNVNKIKIILLWQLAWHSDPMEDILKIAKKKLKEICDIKEYSIISHELSNIISYLLFKSNKKDFEKIKNILLKSKSSEIKLKVSEYYLYNKQYIEAMKIMIDILTNENIDHNVADAITMHISICANPDILKFLEERKENIKKKNDLPLLSSINYAISIVRSIMKN
uniref:hypothetical protein n=1 Tax=Janthinobacterium sp. TaxID=1871054 RepID=UPI002627F0F2